VDGGAKDHRRITERRRRDDGAVALFRYVGALDAVAMRLGRHALVAGVLVVVVAVSYGFNVLSGFDAAATTDGRIGGFPLRAPVTIARDQRDIAHIIAADEDDAFFAQGFAAGSDRLFQMELTRRYAYGTLAEVLGARALAMDESQRYYDIRDLAAAQWAAARASERRALGAYSAGVNAAMRVQPLPLEFRILLYRPQPWTPQDSLAASLAVSIALGDSWRDVLTRDDVWRRQGRRAFDARFPLSDARYDVSVTGSPLHESIARARTPTTSRRFAVENVRRAGSNAWAAGAARTIGGRALLANDPHLDLTIPGLWYLVELRAPGLHVAGASIPGVPGVVLGHNERIAWGATNGDVATTQVFQSGKLERRKWVREVFRVRFSADVSREYYRTPRAFGVPDGYDGDRIVLVRSAQARPNASNLRTFLALDRATTVREAFAVLARYRGPGENFVVADTRGDVGYHLAGGIAADASWGRYVRRAGGLREPERLLPFDRLPSTQPRSDGVVLSANNKMYGNGYPYRLAPFFDPPYRAFRIAELLHARRKYDAAYFARMQLDTVSPIDREFAHRVAVVALRSGDPRFAAMTEALRSWSGNFAPSSQIATFEYRLRTNAEDDETSIFAVLQALRNGDASPELEAQLLGSAADGSDSGDPWGRAGAVAVEHPLAPLHFGFLNGVTFPGAGNEYTIRLQEPGFSQSFRAVWDVGNWDAGGIAIPSGESGEPGSGHYTDLSAAWVSGRMEPLPFSARAVAAATRARLVLTP
jgi:penicillin G amidase